MLVQAGSTDVTTYFQLRNTDGTDATGLTITNIDLQYTRSGASPAAKVDATALGAANSSHSDNTAIEIDATDQPGLYRVDWPDAAFASSAREVILTVKCTGVRTESLRVQLTGFDPAVAYATATALAALETKVDTIDDFLDTEIAAIKAKTDNLPSDPADASDIASSFTTVNGKLDTIDDFLDTEVAAIKAKTDNLPSDPADASDIASSFTTVNTKLDTIDDFIDTEVAAIKAKTDNLPSDPADASDISASFSTVNGKLDTIDDFLDTEVAAIKAKTDNLPSDPADASDIAASFSTVNTKLDTIDDFIDTEIGALTTAVDALPTASEVNAEVLDVMRTDTFAEPGQGTPAATTSMGAKIDYLYQSMRNKTEQTSSELKVYLDNGSTVARKAAVSDDGTTATRGEFITGA